MRLLRGAMKSHPETRVGMSRFDMTIQHTMERENLIADALPRVHKYPGRQNKTSFHRALIQLTNATTKPNNSLLLPQVLLLLPLLLTL